VVEADVCTYRAELALRYPRTRGLAAAQGWSVEPSDERRIHAASSAARDRQVRSAGQLHGVGLILHRPKGDAEVGEADAEVGEADRSLVLLQYLVGGGVAYRDRDAHAEAARRSHGSEDDGQCAACSQQPADAASAQITNEPSRESH